MQRFKLLKNLHVYAPQDLGKMDILTYKDEIVKIADKIEPPFRQETQIEDLSNCYGLPGFVDSHVHIIGGGGEGGFFTRTTPGNETDFFKAGTTAVIGLLGTDGITRTHRELLGQARKFTHNRLRTFLMTGSYALPLVTLLKDLQEDIVFIPEYIGIGEIALSDHRSSGITTDEFRRILLNARVAGLLSGKAGKAVIHMGGVKTALEPLRQAIAQGDISSHQILPTHIARTDQTLEEGKEWINKYDGYIDFTAGTKAAQAIDACLNEGIAPEKILCSSDGWGSIPKFDSNGNFLSVETAPVDTLQKVFKALVINAGHPIQTALKIFTSNVSEFFGISKQGHGKIIEEGVANLCVYDKNLNLKRTLAQGEWVYQD